MKVVRCPHCNHEYDDCDMENSNVDLWAICPEEITVEQCCPACEGHFWIKGSYVPVYEAFKTWEECDDAV